MLTTFFRSSQSEVLNKIRVPVLKKYHVKAEDVRIYKVLIICWLRSLGYITSVYMEQRMWELRMLTIEDVNYGPRESIVKRCRGCN